MPTIALYNMNRDVIGEVALSDEVFNAEVKEAVVHQALKVQLTNRRAGSAKVKNRSEVSGGGRKPFKQKGTGNARQGSSRAAQYPGGGVVFGPQPKIYNLQMNKKARKSAIKSLLTMSNSNNRVTLLDKLDFDKISTRDFAAFMKKFDLERALIVAVDPSQNLLLSARNVPYVKLLKADGLNVYDILKYRNLIFTENSVRIVEGVLQ